MSMDVIKSIKQAEEQAEEIKRQAAFRSRDLLLQAEREGEDYIRTVARDAQREAQVLLEQAEQEARREIESLRVKNDEKSVAIGQLAQGNMQQAVSLIVGKVVGSDGHR